MVGRDYRASDRRVAWLMAVTAAIAVYALGVAWTGGFDARIAGVRLRSHSWIRPAMVAAAGVALLIGIARPQIAALLGRGWSAAESQSVARALVIAAMAWTLAAGLLFGTFASGGADSYRSARHDCWRTAG